MELKRCVFRRRPAWLGIFAAFLALVAVPTGPARAETRGSAATPVVIVLDGSGSMWGGLGDASLSKLAAVRQSLEASLPQIARRSRLGLATFGPGCRSAEMAVAPGEAALESVLTVLQKFNPRGKGPLVAGIEAAVDAIAPEDAGHVIVFHDGLDNCGQNICTAAETIARTHRRLAVHTVSLDLEAAEERAVSCLSAATGGRAFTIGDTAELDAAVAEIVALIAGEKPVETAAPAPPPEPAAPQGPPRLIASASLAEGGAPLTMPLTWRVTDAATGALINETVATSLSLPLRAGRVRVEASAGEIHVAREIEIAAEGPTSVELPLGAGHARFETGVKKLASEADEPLIRLHRLEAGKKAGAKERVAAPLWIARGTAAEALLPPGTYRAVAEFGLARAEMEVSVTSGAELAVALPLEAGRLELSGREAGPGNGTGTGPGTGPGTGQGTAAASGAGNIIYTLAVDDPSRPSGQREIARSAHPRPKFILSTGSYVVTARIGEAEVRRVVAVRKEEVTRETLTGDLARLTVTATINSGSRDNGLGFDGDAQPIVATVTPLGPDGKPQGSGRMVRLGHSFAIEPGRYSVSARLGATGPSARRDIAVAAAADTKVALDIGAAELTISSAPMSGNVSAALCELRNPADERVWRGIETTARIALAPGRYTLRCGSGALRREGPITLAAGERRTVSTGTP